MNHNSPKVITFTLLSLIYGGFCCALPSDTQENLVIACDVQNFQVEQQNTAECSGNVVVTQGSLKMEGDKLRAENQGTEAEKYILIGAPARAQQQPTLDSELVIMEGEKIEFFRPQKQIKATGNVKLVQGGRIVTSHTLDYNLTTGNPHLSKSDQGEDRVRMVIPPRDNSGQNAGNTSHD